MAPLWTWPKGSGEDHRVSEFAEDSAEEDEKKKPELLFSFSEILLMLLFNFVLFNWIVYILQNTFLAAYWYNKVFASTQISIGNLSGTCKRQYVYAALMHVIFR